MVQDGGWRMERESVNPLQCRSAVRYCRPYAHYLSLSVCLLFMIHLFFPAVLSLSLLTFPLPVCLLACRWCVCLCERARELVCATGNRITSFSFCCTGTGNHEEKRGRGRGDALAYTHRHAQTSPEKWQDCSEGEKRSRRERFDAQQRRFRFDRS